MPKVSTLLIVDTKAFFFGDDIGEVLRFASGDGFRSVELLAGPNRDIALAIVVSSS